MNQAAGMKTEAKRTRYIPVNAAELRTTATQRVALLAALRQRRAAIRVRWIELLFVEPVSSPLADPRTMMFMLDETLEQVFGALERGDTPWVAPESVPCECGLNPYVAYFRAGIQAMHEALIWVQAEAGKISPAERDWAFAQVDSIIRGIARREIEIFATLCRHRDKPRGRNSRRERDNVLEFDEGELASRTELDH